MFRELLNFMVSYPSWLSTIDSIFSSWRLWDYKQVSTIGWFSQRCKKTGPNSSQHTTTSVSPQRRRKRMVPNRSVVYIRYFAPRAPACSAVATAFEELINWETVSVRKSILCISPMLLTCLRGGRGGHMISSTLGGNSIRVSNNTSSKGVANQRSHWIRIHRVIIWSRGSTIHCIARGSTRIHCIVPRNIHIRSTSCRRRGSASCGRLGLTSCSRRLRHQSELVLRRHRSRRCMVHAAELGSRFSDWTVIDPVATAICAIAALDPARIAHLLALRYWMLRRIRKTHAGQIAITAELPENSERTRVQLRVLLTHLQSLTTLSGGGCSWNCSMRIWWWLLQFADWPDSWEGGYRYIDSLIDKKLGGLMKISWVMIDDGIGCSPCMRM